MILCIALKNRNRTLVMLVIKLLLMLLLVMQNLQLICGKKMWVIQVNLVLIIQSMIPLSQEHLITILLKMN